MVLGAYLGARYSTGGGCLVYPVSVDSTGVREVIKGALTKTIESPIGVPNQIPHHKANLMPK